MDIFQLYQKRHSCRNYNENCITDERIVDLISAARFAPSACNSQPWKVIIATGDNATKMRECLQDDGRNQYLDNVSAFIAVLEGAVQLKPGSEKKFSNDKFIAYDIGQFVAYLTLYAENQGISSCIIGWVNEKKLKEYFNAEGYNCSLVIALGYSNEDKHPVKVRKGLDEIILNHIGE